MNDSFIALGSMVLCKKDEFRCSSNTSCIPLRAVCDGIFDCVDKTDEHSCPIAGETDTSFMFIFIMFIVVIVYVYFIPFLSLDVTRNVPSEGNIGGAVKQHVELCSKVGTVTVIRYGALEKIGWQFCGQRCMEK